MAIKIPIKIPESRTIAMPLLGICGGNCGSGACTCNNCICSNHKCRANSGETDIYDNE